MSAKSSFCEVTITKSKQVFLTIDLSKKETPKKKSVIKPPPLSPPKTLHEIATRHIEEISNKIFGKLTTKEEKPELGKIIRKLAKKIIKCKKVRLSELAIELGVSKNNLKNWFIKGEKEEDDQVDYDDILKTWILSIGKEMTVEEMFDVINRYTKSVYKSLHKNKQSSHSNFNSQLFEAVIIDSSFPKKLFQPETEMLIEDQGNTHQALDLIQINVSYENVHIKDVVFWDSQDTNPALTSQFAEVMTHDFLQEKSINLPVDKVTEIVKRIQKQISRQVETANDLKAQTESLIAFNGNHHVYKQKECILKINIKLNQGGLNFEDSFDWEVDPLLNRPENFAEKYVKDNNLSLKFASEISSQIRTQLSNYLRKRLTNFLKIYEPKIEANESSETSEGKKKLNNKIKDNIIHSLNENMESFPSIPLPTKAGLFLKNQELFNIVKKYSDYLAPAKKTIFQRQKNLFEQNFKKMTKTEPKKQQQQQPPSPQDLSISDAPSPHNGKPHNLRPRSFNKNYRVLGGDLVNEPVVHEDSEADASIKHIQNTSIKGPSLPSGSGFGDRMLIEDGYNAKGHHNPSRMVYRTNAKRYSQK